MAPPPRPGVQVEDKSTCESIRAVGQIRPSLLGSIPSTMWTANDQIVYCSTYTADVDTCCRWIHSSFPVDPNPYTIQGFSPMRHSPPEPLSPWHRFHPLVAWPDTENFSPPACACGAWLELKRTAWHTVSKLCGTAVRIRTRS